MKKSIVHADTLQIVRDMPQLARFDGTAVLVTGATGLIGSQVVKTLLLANEHYGLRIRVYALARSAEKFDKVFAECKEKPQLVLGDVTKPLSVRENIDYIVHTASVTASKAFVDAPVQTITTALGGTQNVLELADEKQVQAMVYLSSLEVYGASDSLDVREDDYGYIDFLNVRSSYSEGKRMVECMCKAYAVERALPVKIARLTQTLGAGIDYSDNRVFAQFAKSVIEQRDIVLNTPGRTVRSYCYITDAVSAILTILLDGAAGEAYNVANDTTAVSIAQMAQMVCELYPESGIKVVFNTPENLESFGYNPEMRIGLNTDKLKALGWRAQVDLEEMYRRLIEGLREKR